MRQQVPRSQEEDQQHQNTENRPKILKLTKLQVCQKFATVDRNDAHVGPLVRVVLPGVENRWRKDSTGKVPHFGGWAPFPATLIVTHVCLFGPRTSALRVGWPLRMSYAVSFRTAFFSLDDRARPV